MPFNLSRMLTIIKHKLRVDDDRLPEEERLESIRSALEHYSSDRERIRADEVSGTDPFNLPTDFIEGWSTILQIEAPIGSKPPIFLKETHDYEIIETGSGTKVTFIDLTPDLPFRMVFKAQHTLQGIGDGVGGSLASATTIPRAHHRAFGLLACHYGALSIAASWAGAQVSAIRERNVNSRTKESEWRAIADRFLQDYTKVVKNNDEAAIQIMDLDTPPLIGSLRRLWRTRRTR